MYESEHMLYVYRRGNASRHHAKVVSPRRAEPATRIHVV